MLLSIITINYNNAEGLRKTLASVASQTYPHIEHIILDGGSTDGSVEIIRQYADNQAKDERLEVKSAADSIADNQVSTPYAIHHTPPKYVVRWISEPDKGIYNAMNKGLEIALGRRIVNEDHTSRLSPLTSHLSPKFIMPTIPDYATNNAHMFYLVCNSLEERTALIKHLKDNGILAVFHYLSLHSSPYYQDKHDGRALPECDRYADCLVRLPMYYDLKDEDVYSICKVTKDYCIS